MRIDHLAYRTKDRVKTAQFFIDAFGYKKSDEFDISFDDGKNVKCLVLTPPERIVDGLPWVINHPVEDKTKKQDWLSNKSLFNMMPAYLVCFLIAQTLFQNPFISIFWGFLGGLLYSSFVFKQGNKINVEYHLAPEIFISDGEEGSVVDEWVNKNGPSIHHVAYQTDSVERTMQEWKDKGYAEFTTEQPLSCDGLIQVFSKPSEITGIIYELIERKDQGFCKNNVKDLMESTKNL